MNTFSDFIRSLPAQTVTLVGDQLKKIHLETVSVCLTN